MASDFSYVNLHFSMLFEGTLDSKKQKSISANYKSKSKQITKTNLTLYLLWRIIELYYSIGEAYGL